MSDEINPEELRDAIRDVLADRCRNGIAIPDEQGAGLDEELWREMTGLGWLGLAVPEAHGGLGLGLSHLAVLYEELGRVVASAPVLPTMLAAVSIANHGSQEARARWLPAIAAGEGRAAIALPGSGLVTLEASGAATGVIDHVPFADVATLLLLPVSCGAEVALAVIAADRPGISVTPRPLVDLTRSMGRVDLAGVEVSPDDLLRLDTADWDALADHAAIGLGCDAVGGAAALLERTVDYLQTREQFGRPIGSFQALKHRVADWKVKIEAATALARHSAALLDARTEGASATASEVKAYACDTYAAFAGDAVQLHGGIGFTWEHPCHLFLKRAKLSQQLFGTSTEHKERAARIAFGARDPAEQASPPQPHTL